MPVTPVNSTPRLRYRRGEGALLRDDILEVASALFVELGEEKLTMRVVAAAAGVSPPSVYLHFADKDELVLAVCKGLFAELDSILEAAVAGIDDPVEALRARLRAYVAFGVEHPEHYRVLFMKPDARARFSNDELKALACFGHVSANVAAILARHPAREGGLDPYAVTLEVWAAVHGWTSLVITHPTFDWTPLEATVDRICSHLLFGLLTGDGPSLESPQEQSRSA